MSFLFGFEISPGFYSFLRFSWYISGIWLDGMSGGVVGMRELSAWPRVLVYWRMVVPAGNVGNAFQREMSKIVAGAGTGVVQRQQRLQGLDAVGK